MIHFIYILKLQHYNVRNIRNQNATHKTTGRKNKVSLSQISVELNKPYIVQPAHLEPSGE